MGWLSRFVRGGPPPAEGAATSTAGEDRSPRPSPPERLTTLNFEKFLRDHPRVVVDVWAPWCGPCRAFAPIFASAAAEYGHAVGFAKLHADHEPTLVRRLGVRSLPSLLFFRDGRLVRREVGVLPAERFAKRLHLVFRDLA